MTDAKPSPLEEQFAKLETLRDEVKLKAHLAGKELAEFLETHQAELDRVETKVRAAAQEVKVHWPKVMEAVDELIGEVRSAAADARRRLA